MSRFAFASEPFWQTTRVLPGGLALSVDASERAVGTLPPAAGFTELSGPGFGQYAVRSTCASAAVASASTATAANMAAQPIRPANPRIEKPPWSGTGGRSVRELACCLRRFPLHRSGYISPMAVDDDDDWVGEPPEGHYTRDRAKPEFWRMQRPPESIAAAFVLAIVVLVLVLVLH